MKQYFTYKTNKMKNVHDFWNTRFKISTFGSQKKNADLDEMCHSYCSWVSCKKFC